MLDKKVEVNIVGKIDEKGFFEGETNNGDQYKFFCIRSFSSGKIRNIPCIIWEDNIAISVDNLVKIKGELTFTYSKKTKNSEMKVNVIQVEKIN